MSEPEPPGMREPPHDVAASEAPIDGVADADPAPAAPTASEPVFAWTPDLASGRVGNGAATDAAETSSSETPRFRVLDGAIWLVTTILALGIAAASVNLVARAAPASAFDGGRRVGEIVGDVLG